MPRCSSSNSSKNLIITVFWWNDCLDQWLIRFQKIYGFFRAPRDISIIDKHEWINEFGRSFLYNIKNERLQVCVLKNYVDYVFNICIQREYKHLNFRVFLKMSRGPWLSTLLPTLLLTKINENVSCPLIAWRNRIIVIGQKLREVELHFNTPECS